MNLEPITINDVGMTAEESLKAIEQKGVELEQSGKEMFLQGVVTRGNAYNDYVNVDKIGSQRDAAKFFGRNQTDISQYIGIYGMISSANQEQIETMENISVRKLISMTPKKMKTRVKKENIIDAEVIDDNNEIDKLKQEIDKLKQDNQIKFKAKNEDGTTNTFIINTEQAVEWLEENSQKIYRLKNIIDQLNDQLNQDKGTGLSNTITRAINASGNASALAVKLGINKAIFSHYNRLMKLIPEMEKIIKEEQS